MEINEGFINESNKVSDENIVKSPLKTEKLESIIYKLAMNHELDEKDKEVIDQIIEKKDEKIYS